VIHTVLEHLAERLDTALRERKEIKEAVGALARWKGARKPDATS
jgi:hypothetical protein